MHVIANANGLSHVSSEAVTLMMSAVENYLSQILSNVKPAPRVQPPVPTLQPPSLPMHQQTTATDPHIITLEDLLEAVQRKPQLMGEDFSVNQERLSMSLS